MILSWASFPRIALLADKGLCWKHLARTFSSLSRTSDIYSQSNCSSDGCNAPWLKQTVRGVSMKNKETRQEAIENTVYEYVGKNSKRAARTYVWGNAGTGALGVHRFIKPNKYQKGRSEQLTPHKLDFFDEKGLKVKRVGCGYGFTVFACQGKGANEHSIYGTGINCDSQIGRVVVRRKSEQVLDYIIEPVPISLPLPNPGKTKVTAVGCGRAHTILATESDGVFSLGNNGYGQCGRRIVHDEIYRGNAVINRLSLPDTIEQISCGQDHSILRTSGGRLYSCGIGADGQTAQGHYNCVEEPTEIKGDIEGEKIVDVSGRADTILAVTADGHVFGWGNNEYDQLSLCGDWDTQISTPRHLPLPAEVGKVVKAAAGGTMCAVLNDQGQVYVWGFGILGKGPKLDQCQTPTKIPDILFGRNDFNPEAEVTDISCGMHYFAARTNMAEVYTWGRNKQGVCGLSHRLDMFFPCKVMVPADVHAIHCGVDHCVARALTYG